MIKIMAAANLHEGYKFLDAFLTPNMIQFIHSQQEDV